MHTEKPSDQEEIDSVGSAYLDEDSIRNYVMQSLEELTQKAVEGSTELELDGGVMPITIQIPPQVAVEDIVDMLFNADNQDNPTEFVIQRAGKK